MIRLIGIVLAVGALPLFADLADLTRLADEGGLTVLSHVSAKVRVGSKSEFEEGWILIAKEKAGAKKVVALFGGDAGLEAGQGVSYSELPGIAHQLRDYLELRSVAQWTNKIGILAQLILTVSPIWDPATGSSKRPKRFFIEESMGRYEIVNLPWDGHRREMYLDMATAKNSRKSKRCSSLLIRAASIAEYFGLF